MLDRPGRGRGQGREVRHVKRTAKADRRKGGGGGAGPARRRNPRGLGGAWRWGGGGGGAGGVGGAGARSMRRRVSLRRARRRAWRSLVGMGGTRFADWGLAPVLVKDWENGWEGNGLLSADFWERIE